MKLYLIDTNILLDLFTEDSHWAAWSRRQLELASFAGRLVINDVIYAEISVRFAQRAYLDAAIEKIDVATAEVPRDGLFLAGKIYQKYRAAGGIRTGVLPDFFIGAHAATMGWTLITRDERRFRTYFLQVPLITPASTLS